MPPNNSGEGSHPANSLKNKAIGALWKHM